MDGGPPDLEYVAETRFVQSFPGPTELVVIPGADHLFTEKTGLVEEALGEWLRNLP